jgi:hypothetical protein
MQSVGFFLWIRFSGWRKCAGYQSEANTPDYRRGIRPVGDAPHPPRPRPSLANVRTDADLVAASLGHGRGFAFLIGRLAEQALSVKRISGVLGRSTAAAAASSGKLAEGTVAP